MKTETDNNQGDAQDTRAVRDCPASPGSAGIEPRDYEVYKETGVSWEGGKAHPFFSLACRCSTRENAEKAARIIFDEGGQLYLVRIVEVTRISLAHFSPNSPVLASEERGS